MRNITKKIICAAALVSFANVAFAAEYAIDADHTKIAFKVRHLGISWVPGTFTKLEGKFSFDEKAIEKSSAQAKIDVASINTENEKRDAHLKGDEFFAAPKYPAIAFLSKEVRAVKGTQFQVVGDLTMHGVTKSVVLDAEFTGAAKDPWGNERVAFTATTKVNRKDFGLEWNKLLETGALVVGEDVMITVDVEGIKAKQS